MAPIPFGELKTQFQSIEREVRAAMDRVLDRSWFVLGEELKAFEAEFVEWLGVPHCVGVGSGTDAIHLALLFLFWDTLLGAITVEEETVMVRMVDRPISASRAWSSTCSAALW